MYKIHIILFLLSFFTFSLSVQVYAQEGAAGMPASDEKEDGVNHVIVNTNDAVKDLPIMGQVFYRIKLRSPSIFPNEIQSNFFTLDELNLLRQARKGLITSLPGFNDPNYDGDDGSELTIDTIVRQPGPRNIRLGGILFISKSDWALWLNGKEVRPNAIPSTVLDLKVNKKYIELEWFDTQTNQIFPIRLRPNQTFNLDARLFLPG